ncbi:uncharacterized protein MAM_00597 [Metarhizium album ARSEF 1941]|uniref:Uncharacterized protein n=1 Tax=Metarhizium album (strain ARSEF 1941) TaxID=1081103 RepID=A0A0B2X8F6_METAS|nr:uncharacterized protein MAM_00597 [Metarhizium album ARSEF 1941]KHO01596.1 hypothetical protein MAM_00597 [Metarhizium album ARSEF 1941]
MYSGYQLVWVIAACVLLFLTSFPALVIFFCSLCLARRKGDPSRNWLVWFKTGFILFSLAGFSCFLVNLFAVLFSDLYLPNYEPIRSKEILPVQVEFDLLGTLLANLSDICIILAISGLDKGIIVAHNTESSRGNGGLSPGTVQFVDNVFHFSVYGLAGLLFTLSIVAFAIGQHLYSVFGLGSSRIGYDHSFVGSSYSQMTLGKTSQHLSLAVHCMALAVALCILVKSILTKVRCRGDKRVAMASTYLIVCESLFVLRAAYNVGYCVIFKPRDGATNVPPSAFTVVDVVADTWPALVIFCVLFALGCKKRGLWSTMQPVTPGLLDITPQQSPRSYSHNTSQASEADMEFNVPAPQVHEMLQVTSHEQPTHEPIALREIPRLAVNPPPQLQGQQQQIRQTLEAEGEDDSPPDYYSARHQAPPQPPPQHALPFTPVNGPEEAHAGPSFALPTHSGYCSGIPLPGSPPPHADAMGLYHQADGRTPQSQPLPYNEKS